MIRVGILVPAVNTVVEPEMYQMAPEGVTIHFERLSVSGLPSSSSEETEEKVKSVLNGLEDDAPRAARLLAAIQPKLKALAFACNSGSFYKGIEAEKKLIGSIEAASGIPSITASGAAIQALKELGIKKICVITPYTDYQTSKAGEFLESNGFEVPALKGLGATITKHGEQLPEVARDLAIDTFQGTNCDGVYCCCTYFRTLEILEEVEKELGKPMVSANQAMMWLLLKKAGFMKPISGFGSLLRHL